MKTVSRRNKFFAISILASSIGFGGLALAEAVTLSTPDGSLSLTGELLGFEDGIYTLETSIGSMQLAASEVLCEGESCPALVDGDQVIISGSVAIGTGMMPLLLAGYAETLGATAEVTPDTPPEVVANEIIADGGFGDTLANITVNLSDTASGFEALTDPAVQIAMSSRRIDQAEARRITRAGGGNPIDRAQEHIVAVDAVVVLVHPDNPVQAISMENLDNIYSGAITNWSELGGADAPITVYSREHGAGLATVFHQAIFARSGNKEVATAEILDSEEETSRMVSGNPDAIGYTGAAFVGVAKALNIIDECNIPASPDAFTTKAEEYPIQRRLYLYNRDDNLNGTAQTFLDFATSIEADGVITKSGFFSLTVLRDPRPFQGERSFNVIADTTNPAEIPLMRELVVELLQYDRLTATFRFAAGSSALEAKAFADLDRLVDYVNHVEEPVDLMFVGFSDADGSFTSNRGLSIGRAQQVASAAADYMQDKITNTYGVNFSANGFGELMPVACNATLDGKRTNRRVEVWIKRR